MSLIYSPGPAAYEIKSQLGDAPKASIKSRRTERRTGTTPGPGQYRATLPSLSPHYTMRPKTKQGKRELTPGSAPHSSHCTTQL